MRLLWKLAIMVAANAFALYLADKYIEGFQISDDYTDILIAAGVLTAINFFIRPILRVVLSPFIILTLGLASLAINAFIIYMMAKIVPGGIVTLPDLTTGAGLLALLYVTILTSVINLLARRIA